MTYILVDILPIKEGKTIDDALAYFETIRPAMERHGLKRLDAPLHAVNVMRGSQRADLINLVETEDPEASMQGISQDPEYQANTATRDAIFDLEDSSIIITTRRT